MLRLILATALLLSACKTQPEAKSQEKLSLQGEDKGPNVNDLVKPNQEKWLLGQVQNPTKSKINKLVVFGDSLSDPGNLNKRTLGVYAPSRIFYKSRLSNGPIWPDYASTALGWSIENYAVVGAETRSDNPLTGIVIPSFLRQISENKSDLKKMDFTSSLVMVWIGPNNYFFRATKAQDANQNPIPEQLDKLVKSAIEDIKDGILDLKSIGFRRFVVGTMPELGGINRNPKDPIKASDATFFAATAAHNSALRQMLKDLQKEEPEVSVSIFQAFEINQKTIDTPKNYGFNRLDAPCFIGNIQGKFDGSKQFCSDPSGYKFWEYVHPNSKMHCYFASQFLADITTAGIIGGFDQAKALARCQEL